MLQVISWATVNLISWTYQCFIKVVGCLIIASLLTKQVPSEALSGHTYIVFGMLFLLVWLAKHVEEFTEHEWDDAWRCWKNRPLKERS